MKLQVLLVATLFTLVELTAGCQSTQAKPDAPIASKRTRKSKRPKAPTDQAPVAGEVDDGEEDVAEDLTATAPQEGIASFYADSLSGRKTASGARYDPSEATCAHRTLPFGTVLKIEDVDTGKTATCTVNDRGPFVEGRVIDVSKSVAGELGMHEKGIAKVRVRIIDRQRREI